MIKLKAALGKVASAEGEEEEEEEEAVRARTNGQQSVPFFFSRLPLFSEVCIWQMTTTDWRRGKYGPSVRARGSIHPDADGRLHAPTLC